MRISLIADIHGNAIALDTVLRELDSCSIDLLVCLGDVCVLGPQPRECLHMLQERECVFVLGNTDDWLVQAVNGAVVSDTPVMRDLTLWCLDRLTGNDIAAIRAFSPTFSLHAGGAILSCFHGSPHSFDDVISSTTADEIVEAMLAGHEATLWAGGHTHIQMLRRHGHGFIVNPGSVGLPGVGPGTPGLLVNRDVTWAECAIVFLDDGHVSIDLRRVPLDMAAMLRAARASGMPHLDWWTGLYSH